mmetsp:Transcript_86484/g.245244  ORF Transcript_86484/g.245244 Transcript_86484/m.245244 type:complete len:261 (-) Transcript_86484:184-966(-)
MAFCSEGSPRAIPGYRGYVPGVIPHADVMGKTFANTNEHAMNKLSSRQNTPRATAPKTPRPVASPICGYTGHLQGKGDSHGLGMTFAVRAKSSAEIHQAKSPQVVEASTLTPSQLAGAQSMKAINGYKGHIPGKKAGNVYGAIFTAANHEAAGKQGEHERPLKRAVAVEVPGYTGYVPGKKPEQHALLGKTFGAANGIAPPKGGGGGTKHNKGGTKQVHVTSGQSSSSSTTCSSAGSKKTPSSAGSFKPPGRAQPSGPPA